MTVIGLACHFTEHFTPDKFWRYYLIPRVSWRWALDENGPTLSLGASVTAPHVSVAHMHIIFVAFFHVGRLKRRVACWRLSSNWQTFSCRVARLSWSHLAYIPVAIRWLVQGDRFTLYSLIIIAHRALQIYTLLGSSSPSYWHLRHAMRPYIDIITLCCSNDRSSYIKKLQSCHASATSADGATKAAELWINVR